jgi:hypothetical protein
MEYIYYLIDPITDDVKYVGKSKKPKSRYNQHIKKLDKGQTPKRKWLQSLFDQGLKPRLKVVEEVDGNAREREQHHVTLHQNTILNIHNPEKGMASRDWNEIN